MRRPAYSYRDDPAVPDFADDRPIIVFDGECVFCSGWVRFVLKRDTGGRYRFVTAQSPLGAALYRHYGLDDRNYETNLLIEDGVMSAKSAATSKVLASLGFPWSIASAVRIIPAAIVDPLYDLVARNRYRIAGRRDTCFVPSPEDRARFIN
jgi:predicted DCC family thiol-disulfide oxidoreductase YuxK